jgi:hypothetical protein
VILAAKVGINRKSSLVKQQLSNSKAHLHKRLNAWMVMILKEKAHP